MFGQFFPEWFVALNDQMLRAHGPTMALKMLTGRVVITDKEPRRAGTRMAKVDIWNVEGY